MQVAHSFARLGKLVLAPLWLGAAPLLFAQGAGEEQEERNWKVSRNLGGQKDVVDFASSPDGRWAVYRADQDTNDVYEIYSRPVDRSAPHVKLSPPLGEGGSIPPEYALGYEISADSRRVIMLVHLAIGIDRELYSVPIDGSEAPILISSDGGPNPVGGCNFGTCGIPYVLGGERVLYTRGHTDALVDRLALYSAPLDGSEAPVRLSLPLSPDQSVARRSWISPDGEWALFNLGTGYDFEPDGYFLVPTDGSLAPRWLAEFGEEPSFSPDGTEFMALAGVGFDDLELIRFSTDPNVEPQQLTFDAHPEDFQLDAAWTWVVYRESLQGREIYGLPLEPNAQPVELSGPMVEGGDSVDYAISPDGTWVAYLADQDTDGLLELYSVPIDGSLPRIRLNQSLGADGTAGSFRINSDNQNVTFLYEKPEGARELFRVPIDGSGPALGLNAPLAQGSDVTHFELTPDGERCVYYVRDFNFGVPDELFRTSTTPGGISTRVNGPLASFGEVRSAPNGRITPDGILVYLADQERYQRQELFATRLNKTPSRAEPPTETVAWPIR